MTLHVPAINYLALLPFLLVTAAALKLLMLTALMRRRIATSLATWTAVVAGLAVLGTTLVQWYELDRYGSSVTAAGAIVYDPFGVLMTAGIAVSLILAVLNGHDWQRREGIVGAEYQMLVLLAAGGAILMAQANDLIIVFLGLEILSIALYCLIAFNRRRQASAESAMKYFLLGGFAAAIFIYGVALTYGATGTTNLTNIAYFLGSNHLLHPGLLLAGGGLMLVAFVFKVEAAPFHFWAPDVYEGEPTPLSGAHASIVWAGAFAALVRIMVVALGSQQSTWRPLFFGLIVASIATGALLTIQQSNAKRLLAYASVTQSGFVLLGIWAGTASGVAATTFYVVTYGPVVLATFAIVGLVSGPGDSDHALTRYQGLSRRNPWLAASLAVLLLSQLGVPFTTGFDAKFGVLAATLDAGNVWGAVVAMMGAAVAAFAYLRWTTTLYADVDETLAPLVVPWATRVVVGFGVLTTVVVGVDPGLITSISSHATLLFQ